MRSASGLGWPLLVAGVWERRRSRCEGQPTAGWPLPPSGRWSTQRSCSEESSGLAAGGQTIDEVFDVTKSKSHAPPDVQGLEFAAPDQLVQRRASDTQESGRSRRRHEHRGQRLGVGRCWVAHAVQRVTAACRLEMIENLFQDWPVANPLRCVDVLDFCSCGRMFEVTSPMNGSWDPTAIRVPPPTSGCSFALRKTEGADMATRTSALRTSARARSFSASGLSRWGSDGLRGFAVAGVSAVAAFRRAAAVAACMTLLASACSSDSDEPTQAHHQPGHPTTARHLTPRLRL